MTKKLSMRVKAFLLQEEGEFISVENVSGGHWEGGPVSNATNGGGATFTSLNMRLTPFELHGLRWITTTTMTNT